MGDETVRESTVEFNFDNEDNNDDIIDYLIETEELDVQDVHYENVEFLESERPSVNIPKQTRQNASSNKKLKLSIPSKRLERSLKQCENIVTVSQTDYDMRQKYYDAKLHLLEKQVDLQERIAIAKERQI